MDASLIDKVPPNNVESEQAVLGALLLNWTSMADVVSKLRSEHFYSLQNQIIYDALLKLYKKNVQGDTLSLINELTVDKKLEQAGGTAYIASLTDTVPSAANIEYYSNMVLDRAARRELIRISSELRASAYELNRDTGELYNCNAGDNKLHILDGKTKVLKEITLSDVTPTAGGIPSDLIEMKGGFKVEKLQLNPGDILYLYTDGIDEAERLVRDFDFTVKHEVKEEKRLNKATGKEETSTQVLEIKEQFGQKRIEDIIQAVARKQRYVLEKQDNPIPSDILEFDFSSCNEVLEDSIIALASVERVFRMVKSPAVRQTNEISVENFIDDFLRKHFMLYSKYCVPVLKSEPSEKDSSDQDEIQKLLKNEDVNVTKYSSMQEDKQADDITLIAIRRL